MKQEPCGERSTWRSAIAPPLQDLRWIGVDEVSPTGGHVYFTIVTNLRTGRVVWIGDGKGRRGLLPFLRIHSWSSTDRSTRATC